MKKKGFTLIELLAVIVILAVIAIIVTPMITNTITLAKKNSINSSAKNYEDAVAQYVMTQQTKGNEIPDGKYSVSSLSGVEISGKKPNTGYVVLKSGQVDEMIIVIDNYYVKKSSGSDELIISPATDLAGTLRPTTQPTVVNDMFVYDRNEYYKYRENITSITFDNKINIPTDAKESWDVSILGDGSVMAYVTEDTTTKISTYSLHIQSNGKTKAPEDSSFLFGEFSDLKVINNLENFDTSNVTDMSSMFCYCYNLTTLDLSTFNTSKVTNMAFMFDRDSRLTSLNVSSFDTSNVTDMDSMFSDCQGLTILDLSSFDVSKVIDMFFMFSWTCNLNTIKTPINVNGDIPIDKQASLSGTFIDSSSKQYSYLPTGLASSITLTYNGDNTRCMEY